MTLLVTGKGDLTILPLFQPDDFASYELYLRIIDESAVEKVVQLPAHTRIISIHTPAQIMVGGKSYPFDLGQPDPIGYISLQALQEIITIAKKCKAKIVVVHGASYNAFLESQEEAMRRLADRVRPLLDDKQVRLCFETDVLWHNLFYSRRALLTSPDDFKLLKFLLPGKVKITADFEHLSITFHFREFLAHIGGENVFLQHYSEIAQRKFEVDCQEFIKKNFTFLQEKFQLHLHSFFTTFHDDIEHIHINGSDCCNYLFHPQTSLPFIGEHLPLGLVENNVFGNTVSDKFDYSFVASLLHSLPGDKTIHMVMEIWRTDQQAFIQAARESKKFLEKYLAQEQLALQNHRQSTPTQLKWLSLPSYWNSENGTTVYIRDREISNFGRPFIIAEIGSNHNGDLEMAKKLIDAAAASGADCAKFQSWTKLSLFSKKIYENNAALEKDIDLYSFGLRDTLQAYRELKAYCDRKGIIFATSVFNEAEADFFVDELEMDFIKVASMDVNNLPFLEYLAKKGKPLVLSTGLSTMPEIAEAVQIIRKHTSKLILLHCLSVYPDAQQGLGSAVAGELDAGINLNNIEMLRTAFELPVGFSDNAPGTYVPLAAIAKGACVIEKHFTLDKNLPGWDHAISADPRELKMIVEGSHIIHDALGSSQRILSSKEWNMRSVFRRSIVFSRDLPAGHALTPQDLVFKRPGTGLEPKQASFLIGRTLRKAVPADDLLRLEDLA